MIIAIISIFMLFSSHGAKNEKHFEAYSQVGSDTITTNEGIESHKNTQAYIKGKFQKFTPWTSGKGANHMFWDWEIVLPGGGSYPVITNNTVIDLSNYENQNVLIYGNVFYGIIIGDSNPDHQSMRGYRIDAEEISFAAPTDPRSKITLNLDEFNEDGMRERPKGEFSSTFYEFCIPATDEAAKEVQSIDPTAGIYKTSKGRSGCTDKEWLCISKTRQPDFKKVILKLAELNYIRKISETFWE